MSAVIRSVLSPLIKIWLRSQVESIHTLEIEIAGRDGQILKGLSPSAKVMATGVVYQGLHLSDLCLTASEIHLNTPQVLRGEALKLLQPIQVNLELNLTPSDLKHCLDASLLTEALGTFENPMLEQDADDLRAGQIGEGLCEQGDRTRNLRRGKTRATPQEGHVRGIKTMVQQSSPCPDVLLQIAAVRGALDRVARIVLDEHVTECVQRAAKEGNLEAEIEQLKAALDRFLPGDKK